MKKAFILAVIAVFPLLGDSLDPVPACPARQGVYYLASSTWKSLQLLNPSGNGSPGMGRGMLTHSSNIKESYRDAEARVTVQPAAQFCVVGFGSPLRDLVVIQMDQKKDHRELQLGHADTLSGVKMEYKKGDLQPVKMESLTDNIVMVSTPGLKPGQYLLIPTPTSSGAPTGRGGYDFGVK
jgi:hypothetical protein